MKLYDCKTFYAAIEMLNDLDIKWNTVERIVMKDSQYISCGIHQYFITSNRNLVAYFTLSMENLVVHKKDANIHFGDHINTEVIETAENALD